MHPGPGRLLCRKADLLDDQGGGGCRRQQNAAGNRQGQGQCGSLRGSTQTDNQKVFFHSRPSESARRIILSIVKYYLRREMILMGNLLAWLKKAWISFWYICTCDQCGFTADSREHQFHQISPEQIILCDKCWNN